jgi:hypothetical protein
MDTVTHNNPMTPDVETQVLLALKTTVERLRDLTEVTEQLAALVETHARTSGDPDADDALHVLHQAQALAAQYPPGWLASQSEPPTGP